MAAPVVTGVAALILEFYPNLTPQQVKYCIERSAVPLSGKVKLPGTEEKPVLVNLSDISKTGGIVNAYEALKVASTLHPEKKEVLERSTLHNVNN